MTAPQDVRAWLDELDAAREKATEPTPIPDAPEFGVTPDGRVWSLSSDWRGYGVRPLATSLNRDGYEIVRLPINGRRVNKRVHILVLTTLVGARPSIAHQARHLNGCKTDNRLANLRWGTAKENAADRDVHGTTASGSRNGASRLSEAQVRAIRDRYALGASQYALAAEYGVSQSMVSQIVRGKWWKA